MLAPTVNKAIPGFLGIWEKGIYIRGTKTILGNREHKEQSFEFWVLGERANLFKGKREQVHPPPRSALLTTLPPSNSQRLRCL